MAASVFTFKATVSQEGLEVAPEAGPEGGRRPGGHLRVGHPGGTDISSNM